jgi:hypothetical protein
MPNNEITQNTSGPANTVTAPVVAVNGGSGNLYFQPGTPAVFAGQEILNNQETGAFVNMTAPNNMPGQKTNQTNIQSAIGKQLKRISQLPNFSPINTRETGGIFTPDNNVFAGINFGGAGTARAASTALIADLSALVVVQDGITLIAGNLFLVKNGAVPKVYTAVNAASTANVNLGLTLDGVTVDGVVLAAGNRVLLKDQTLPAANGLYTVVVSPGVATRATDMDTTGEVIYGGSALVSAGTANTGKTFLISTKPAVLGTNPLAYTDLATQAGFLITHAFDGLYVVGVVAGTAPLTRSTDFNTAVTVSGMVVNVTSGTANGGKTFINLQTNVVTLGVTDLDFENLAEFQATALTSTDKGDLNSDTQVYQLY